MERPGQRGERASAAGRDLSNTAADSRRTTAPYLREGPRWERLCGRRRTRGAESRSRRFRTARGAHCTPRAPALSAGPTFAPKICCPRGRRRTCPHLSPAGDTSPRLPPSAPPASGHLGPRDPVPYQVSPFRSEVLSSVTMSERWVSRSAAPPSAIFFH